MVDRLPAWLFLSLALILMGFALLPIPRAIVLGIAPEIRFIDTVMFSIAGLMCGLSAMILLVRRQGNIDGYQTSDNDNSQAVKLHTCALLLYSGIPLANFLLCYWLWLRNRHKSEWLDRHGKEVLNFQITIYLYLLLSLFLTFAVIGVFFIPFLLIIHLILTLTAIVKSASGHSFQYPLNIPIIEGRISS